nr:Protein translation factor SUI1-like [Ipomoea trifida]
MSPRSEHPNFAQEVYLSVRSFNCQPRFMSELDLQTPAAFDPFAEANAESSGAGSKDYVHIRVQQRNGRKSLTTVQGLKKEFSYNKILKDLKKEFCCNGTVVQDPELGQVIQLQGDQRKNVSTFLVQQFHEIWKLAGGDDVAVVMVPFPAQGHLNQLQFFSSAA